MHKTLVEEILTKINMRYIYAQSPFTQNYMLDVNGINVRLVSDKYM